MKSSLRSTSPSSTGPTTIKEVAAEAGVSTASVSRVLAGMNGVTREVRERVMVAAAKLSYHPNRLARSLRVGQRKVIGVIIPDLRNPFFTAVAHGVEGALYSEGYTLQLGNSDGQPEREQLQLGIMRGEGVAGLVFIAGNCPSANYDALRIWDIPLVAVDRSPGGLEVDRVSSNNRDGMRQAVAHLLGLGYREIALLSGPAGIDVAEERLGGYLDALRSAGVPVREDLVINGDFGHEGGHEAMGRLLDLPQAPRAVVVANNLMTLGAIQQVEERQVRIPDDLALVGFDDMPWAGFLRPPLTTVAQAAEELGKIAAQLLIERIKDPQRAIRQVVLPTRLVVRASCGALRGRRPADFEQSVPQPILSIPAASGRKSMPRPATAGRAATASRAPSR
jgi:LacI family transcriptional regulator